MRPKSSKDEVEMMHEMQESLSCILAIAISEAPSREVIDLAREINRVLYEVRLRKLDEINIWPSGSNSE